jgi:hypothetical protein
MGLLHVGDRRLPNGRSLPAFGAGWRQSARAPGSKTICISTFDQEGVLLAATRKRLGDLNSVTSCLKLGQAPYAT